MKNLEDISGCLPDYAFDALSALEAADIEAWLVGGCVRDALRGLDPSDIDIASSASPLQARQAFESLGWTVIDTGIAHGTITAIHPNGSPIEVTMFRLDGDYADGRHPDDVRPARSIQEDLARRDFTINALAWHPSRGLIDPFGGIADLEARVIRCVGNPQVRFKEDALRILRACRFHATLGFQIESSTRKAMYERKGRLCLVSAERILHELDRLLVGDEACTCIIEDVDVLCAVLPELVACKGFDQKSVWHCYDVLEHIAHTVDYVPATPLLRWAALLHDIGKPAAYFTREDGRGHFYDHAHISEQLAIGIADRLKMPAARKKNLVTLVGMHDRQFAATPAGARKMLRALDGDVELSLQLCHLKEADSLAHASCAHERAANAQEMRRLIRQVVENNEAFTVRQLAVNGEDAMAAGVPKGPDVGRMLQHLLDLVVEGALENERETLLAEIASQQQ